MKKLNKFFLPFLLLVEQLLLRITMSIFVMFSHRIQRMMLSASQSDTFSERGEQRIGELSLDFFLRSIQLL